MTCLSSVDIAVSLSGQKACVPLHTVDFSRQRERRISVRDVYQSESGRYTAFGLVYAANYEQISTIALDSHRCSVADDCLQPLLDLQFRFVGYISEQPTECNETLQFVQNY